MAKKSNNTATTQTAPATSTPAPATPAPAATTPAPDGKKRIVADTSKLVFELATPEQIAAVPEPTRAAYGLRAQLADAVKSLPVKGGIIVAQEFKRVRSRVGSINRNKVVTLKNEKGEDFYPSFYVREHEGKVYVIRES